VRGDGNTPKPADGGATGPGTGGAEPRAAARVAGHS
jgi:hypothetical protein